MINRIDNQAGSMKFTEFDLNSDLQKGINDAGFVDCMPVQEETLTHSLAGKDVCVQSQTGSGKTVAFLISIYQLLLKNDKMKEQHQIYAAYNSAEFFKAILNEVLVPFISQELNHSAQ